MADINNINVNGITYNIVDDEAMRLVSNPINNNILVTDSNGQAVDSGVDVNDISSLPSGGSTGQVLTKQSNADGDVYWSTPTNSAFSFVGMVVQATNLTTESALKNIFGSTTSWQLLSSVALAINNVFGNGKALGLSDGSTQYGLLHMTGSNPNKNIIAGADGYGASNGTSVTGAQAITAPSTTIGVVSKTEAGSSPENTGLIVDTITIYTWERTL